MGRRAVDSTSRHRCPVEWSPEEPLFTGPVKYYNHKNVYFPSRVEYLFSAKDPAYNSPNLLAQAVQKVGGLIQNNHPIGDPSPRRANVLTYLVWILGFVLGIVGLFVLICLPHNVRIWRVRRVYRSLPADVVDQVLHFIEQAAARGPSVTFLRLAEEVACDDAVLVRSHVGGVPYAESGDNWPQRTPEGDPAKFMLQVRLDHPALGDQWQVRLIVVFLIFDYEQVVRSYAAPSIEKSMALEAKRPPSPCVLLKPIRVPAESGAEGVLPMLPDRLCDDFPEITVPLEPYTNDFAGVLAQILRPNVYGYDLDAPRIAYVGGDPLLIQNPHDPVCDQCGKPMRFLFQFGEVVPGVQMADDGVCYVYGCDDHPGRCKGFVDSH